MKTNRFALLAILTFLGAASARAEVGFFPTGVIDMIPTSMTDDASIVVGIGFFGDPNLYYTEAGGAVVIGDGCGNGLPRFRVMGRPSLDAMLIRMAKKTPRNGSAARAGRISGRKRAESPATLC